MKRALFATGLIFVFYVAAAQFGAMYANANPFEAVNGSAATYRVLSVCFSLAHDGALLWAAVEWSAVLVRVIRGRKHQPIITRG
jgi:hypothetical protein